MAQDCQNWQRTDLSEAKRGMEVSILKYRLAKEQSQQARAVLDDILEVSQTLRLCLSTHHRLAIVAFILVSQAV